MGCYDTVIVPCPKCGTPEAFQSKGGPCDFESYALDACPADILADVNRHAPIECQKCKCGFEVFFEGKELGSRSADLKFKRAVGLKPDGASTKNGKEGPENEAEIGSMIAIRVGEIRMNASLVLESPTEENIKSFHEAIDRYRTEFPY